MPGPDVAGLVHEHVLDGVTDGEGRGLAAERVEDLDLVRVLVPAGAGGGYDEPAVGQPVQARPPGPYGAQLGEFDVAVGVDGDDQRVEGLDVADVLRSPIGEQPVGGAEGVDGTGRRVTVMVLAGQTGVGDEGGSLHGRALLGGGCGQRALR
ncbi:hypothetical protein ACFV60_32350 [Streptomyces virginiae]|uniref:hypothetical protein n=1 Tax=Streptomyces virginiae TaxID=1961 RepID=UPI003653FCCC